MNRPDGSKLRDSERIVGKQEINSVTSCLLVTRDQSLGRQGVHISRFDVSEISVVDGVDFNRAE
jgi:hypothetical protein